MPAVKDFETGKSPGFEPAIGKSYLMAESGASDHKIIVWGWCLRSHVDLRLFKPTPGLFTRGRLLSLLKGTGFIFIQYTAVVLEAVRFL